MPQLNSVVSVIFAKHTSNLCKNPQETNVVASVGPESTGTSQECKRLRAHDDDT